MARTASLLLSLALSAVMAQVAHAQEPIVHAQPPAERAPATQAPADQTPPPQTPASRPPLPPAPSGPSTSLSDLVIKRPGVLFVSPAGEPFRKGTDMTKSMRIWFDQADTNHDGGLSVEEFEADHARVFALWDLNHDGLIDGGEIARYEHDIAPEILTIYDRDDQVPPRGAHGANAAKPKLFGGRAPELLGAAEYGVLNEPEPLSVADTDVDFRISVAEWRQAADRRFARLDTNRDGRITFDELILPPDPPPPVAPKGRRKGLFGNGR